ncbi:LytR/AlgR family response regulator transcription factor [Mucilaginibacter aquaedulcis]|jgi:two-component system response regulator LytT|uniref:LytR/AlgR family response regulator transcription factor n=1 Tax=Mucilaginibacter aquaedulcis TaxID=1187081 RepID=UPI0025B30324|nr:LytTR family DNA-binding domain-containing protein [Mucilaginibacter aquaedulcis]MDN3551642.1 LytTR family DNA-binding domain-containing protein [Mucilaginibacter aquaedulcis]
MIINCIAVDDEPVALKLVASYIEQTPFLTLKGTYTNAVEALKAIHAQPDIQLIFLDIRMADLSGVELARIIEQSGKKKSLRIVFTTAYDHYALEGFKVDALDYLLKPFSFVDFSKAAAKAYDYFIMLQNSSQSNNLNPADHKAEKNYIYLKIDYQLVKINTEDILYIEGLKDYVKLFLKNHDKPLLTLTSLKSLEEKLSPAGFLRIHRSFIIARNAVKSVTKNTVQIGETTIPVTEQYKIGFSDFLKDWQ